MYTIKTFNELVDEIMKPSNYRPTDLSTYTRANGFEVELQDDGKQLVTIPVTGHNPKNIKVDVNEDSVMVKSDTESTSKFVRDIDLSLSVGEEYNPLTTSAKFENGLLTLLIDKKVDRQSKSVKISY